MNREFQECLKKGKIKKFSRGRALALKELEIAGSDLARAKKTLKDRDYKWATIQVYYSMFHSARALLYYKNYREHSHYCLIRAIRALFVEEKVIPLSFIDALQEAKELREDADYFNRWSKSGCGRLIKVADKWLIECQEIMIST